MCVSICVYICLYMSIYVYICLYIQTSCLCFLRVGDEKLRRWDSIKAACNVIMELHSCWQSKNIPVSPCLQRLAKVFLRSLQNVHSLIAYLAGLSCPGGLPMVRGIHGSRQPGVQSSVKHRNHSVFLLEMTARAGCSSAIPAEWLNAIQSFLATGLWH